MTWSTTARRRRRAVLLSAASTLAFAGCASAGASAGQAPDAPLRVLPAPTPTAASLPPVQLPHDEGPHDVLAEWWYYTGHLYPQGGQGPGGEYGFELVFFRGVRGDRPPGYAAHFAITDVARSQFVFDQRQDLALSETASGAVGHAAPPAPAPGRRPAGVISLPVDGGGFDFLLKGWRIRGQEGHDSLAAEMPGYSLDLQLTATRPPALHTGYPPLEPGLLSFGPAGYSYYYSRTRMDVAGTLNVDGQPVSVGGTAWMDHQWGNFLVLGGGGWDWYAGNLNDGRDLTISAIRDASGSVIISYGTLVEPDGQVKHLPPGSFEVTATGVWTSPRSGVRYPSGWRLLVPGAGLDLHWSPLLQDQELDARPSSGVIYWEGATALHDAASGAELGRGYVELTGYTK